jgi:hypothetical protein
MVEGNSGKMGALESDCNLIGFLDLNLTYLRGGRLHPME